MFHEGNSVKALPVFGGNCSLVETLCDSGVTFLIVGGHAVHFYIPTRLCNDLDVLIGPTKENAERVLCVFRELHLEFKYPPETLTLPYKRIPLHLSTGLTEYDADILTPGHDGDFHRAWESARFAKMADRKVRVAPRHYLIQMKERSERTEDREDIRQLEDVDIAGLGGSYAE